MLWIVSLDLDRLDYTFLGETIKLLILAGIIPTQSQKHLYVAAIPWLFRYYYGIENKLAYLS